MNAIRINELRNNCDAQYVLIVLIFFCGVSFYFWLIIPFLLLLLGFIQIRSALHYFNVLTTEEKDKAMFIRYRSLILIWTLLQTGFAFGESLSTSVLVAVTSSLMLAIWLYVQLKELKMRLKYNQND